MVQTTLAQAHAGTQEHRLSAALARVQMDQPWRRLLLTGWRDGTMRSRFQVRRTGTAANWCDAATSAQCNGAAYGLLLLQLPSSSNQSHNSARMITADGHAR
jgi:hypothetical protein